MEIQNYDSWKLSCGQEDEKVYSNCVECGNEIYEGEEYYSIDGEPLHDDCLNDYVKEHIAERKTAGE